MKGFGVLVSFQKDYRLQFVSKMLILTMVVVWFNVRVVASLSYSIQFDVAAIFTRLYVHIRPKMP